MNRARLLLGRLTASTTSLLLTCAGAGLLGCDPTRDPTSDDDDRRVEPNDTDDDDGNDGDDGEGGDGDGDDGDGDDGDGDGAAGPAFFVAVGEGGRRLVSAAGETWQHDVAEVDDGGDDDRLFRGVCAGVVQGQRVLLAVGGSARGRVLRSVDDGVSWSLAVDDDRGWIGACAIDDAGVAVFVGSGRSDRSLDGGRTLIDPGTQRGAQGNWQLRDVVVAGDVFVAVGDAGVSTSVDGVVWSEPRGPRGLSRVAVGVFGGTMRAVAVGASVRATSADLSSWSESPIDGGRDVVCDGARFVVVGIGLRQVSTDGVSFAVSGGPAIERLAVGVVDGRPRFVGVRYPDRRQISDDAEIWTDVAAGGASGNALVDVVFVPARPPTTQGR